jgi:hypothetical protein
VEITILDDPEGPDAGPKDDEVDRMIIDSITSPTKKPQPKLSDSSERYFTPDQSPGPPTSPGFDLHQANHKENSFAETNSQTSCPLWCEDCGAQNPDGDAIVDEVQCERCRNWSHFDCLPSGVDWHSDDVRFVCKYCREADPLADT